MNRYYVLLVTTLSTLMAAVDSTIVYLALPEIGENFQTNVSNLTLVIVIYIISSTVMLAPAIEIIKKFGNREFYITGFSLFTASSLFVALSPGINFMIISRFFEGIGAGIMTATDIPIILNAFPQEERGRAVGINSISWSVGTLMGPLLGGFLVLFNWRYIFLINVPVGILAIFFAFKFIRKAKN
ncbi:MFS transporter [Acidiplasma sp.]|uniref:MFS transporter n=1 Tax=Acidiplasma sp. TaxID=1872114 RepID=UPI00258EAE3A|nr:MFS transporter [Acidiplasma sp.]